MKKIGILTYHNTNNYGALFQCYALQRFINENNVFCEVLDYNNAYLKKVYDINPFHAKSIKSFIKKTINFLPEKNNINYFLNFKNKYISISKKEYNEKNIEEADSEYDTFISGSDQVWNYDLSGKDKNYFMMFTKDKIKRNSYAASFGSGNIKSEYKEDIVKYLKNQNNISIREDEAKKMILSHCPKLKVKQNIDPVFLLDKKVWLKFIQNKQYNNYIFVYEVARTEKLRSFAKRLSEKTGLKIIYLSKAGKKMKGVKRLYSVTPEEFLSLIYNANYVVTSSFHGMAFSLIFEKIFYYDTPKSQNEFGARLNSLSRLTKTENQKINENFDITMKNLNIDYKSIEVILGKAKSDSIKYLNTIIK